MVALENNRDATAATVAAQTVARPARPYPTTRTRSAGFGAIPPPARGLWRAKDTAGTRPVGKKSYRKVG